MDKKERKHKPQYCHITPVENIESILEKGLLANEKGEIFIFDNVFYEDVFYEFDENKGECKKYHGVDFVSNHIARNQIFLDRFALFRVYSKGFTNRPTEDNVGEITARFQFILRQKRIAPEYLEFLGICETGNPQYLKSLGEIKVKHSK